MRNSKEFEDATVSMLSLPTVYKIVDIMEYKMPLSSDAAREIIESYIKDGKVSNEGIDFIVLATEDKLPNIGFKEIADNEAGIIPFYIKKLGLDVSEVRQKLKTQGL